MPGAGMHRNTTWTIEQDAGLAVGAALGMSASQIAQSIGGMTRNAVIGRAHRLKISLNGKRATTYANAEPKTAKPKAERARRRNSWTPEEDAVLRNGNHRTAWDIAGEIGRSEEAVKMRRMTLGIASIKRRFTSAEDDTIRADFAAFVPVEDIALKLGRDVGTLQQRILRLGLRRDGRKTRLAKRFGIDVLNLSDDPAEIQRRLQEQEKVRRAVEQAAFDAKVQQALDLMDAVVANGEDRRLAMQAAMLAGATLEQVGCRFGITRERVRQIVHGVQKLRRPPRTVVCAKCSAPFECVGSGLRKYCDGCRPIIAQEQYEARKSYSREYLRAYRKTAAAKAYKREWTRRDRLKKKMMEVPPAELAKVLREVASQIE